MIVEAIAATTAVTIGQGRGRLHFAPGCFSKACRSDRTAGVPVLIDHDSRRQVGRLIALWEVPARRVLFCRVLLAGSLGEHLGSALQEDSHEWGLSLGYEPDRYRIVNGTCYVERVPRLREVSFCRKWTDWGRSPKNPATRILRVA